LIVGEALSFPGWADTDPEATQVATGRPDRAAYFRPEQHLPKMTDTFISQACSDLPVAVCCRVMKVSTSGFYA
jgi:hypothetical protein